MAGVTYYTTKEDLRRVIPGEWLYTPGDSQTRRLILKISGGTTGVPVVNIRFAPQHRAETLSHFVRLTPKNTSILAMVAGATLEELPSHPVSVLPMNMAEYERLSAEEISAVFATFKPREFRTTRTTFLNIIDDLEEKEALDSLGELRSIDISAETVEVSHLRSLRHVFPGIEVRLDYGLSDGGGEAYLCDHEVLSEKEPTERRYHPDSVHSFEIINPDKDGFGEIVTTSRELYRFKTGDLGKLVDEKCSCGAPQALYIGGRVGHDVVLCAGATFFASDIDKIFNRFQAHLADYIVEVTERAEESVAAGRASCDLVLKPPVADTSELKVRVQEALLRELYITPTRTLGDLIQEGVFLPLDVRFVESVERTSQKRYHLRKRGGAE